MKIVYDNTKLTFEIVTNTLYKLVAKDFVVETYKIGILDENEKDRLFNVTISFDDNIDNNLLKNAIYVSRGTCMNDKDPLVISFGGLIGKFDINASEKIEVDKDVNRTAYMYICFS